GRAGADRVRQRPFRERERRTAPHPPLGYGDRFDRSPDRGAGRLAVRHRPQPERPVPGRAARRGRCRYAAQRVEPRREEARDGARDAAARGGPAALTWTAEPSFTDLEPD